MLSKNFFKKIFIDLDGICQLKIFGEKELVDAVEREFRFYLSQNKPPTLDIEIELRWLKDYKPAGNPPNLSPFDFPYQHKLAKGMVRFERLSQPPHRIRFYGNIFSKLTVAKQIIEPAIRWKAQELGFIFVHSAGLVKGERAVIIAGRGGSGKSLLLLAWLGRGNSFLSDDFTILSYHQARRYLSPIRVGAGILQKTGAGENLSLKRKLEIYFRTVLRRLLFGYARLQAKLDIKELFPEIEITERASLAGVVICEPIKDIEKINSKDMAELILKLNQEEMYGFERYLDQLSQRAGAGELFSFSYEYARLIDYISDLPCYKIPFPSKMKKKELDELIRWIEQEFFNR